jgi:O-antigen ligase
MSQIIRFHPNLRFFPAGLRGPAVSGSIAVAGALYTAAVFTLPPSLALAALLGPPVVLAVLHRPKVGLVLLIVSNPIINSTLGEGLDRVANYLFPVLVLAVWAVRLTVRPRPVRPLPGGLHAWFLAFSVWILFCAAFSEYPAAGMVESGRFLLLLFVLTAIWNEFSSAELKTSLALFAALMVPSAAIAVQETMTTGVADVLFARGIQPERQTALYENPNTFGVLTASAFVIVTAFLLRPSRGPRNASWVGGQLALGAVSLLLLAGVLVSFSRSNYLYVGVAFLVLCWVRPLTRWLSLAALGAGVLAPFVLPLPLWLVSGLRLSSGLSSREALWEAAWRMFQANPWTGVGSGAEVFERLSPVHMDTDVQRVLTGYLGGGAAHNIWLTKAAELGAVGLALTAVYFLLASAAVPRAIRRYREGDWTGGAAAAGVIGLSVGAFVEVGPTLGTGRLNELLVFQMFVLALWMGGAQARDRRPGSAPRAAKGSIPPSVPGT